MQCLGISQFINPFTCSWTFGLCPVFAYQKQSFCGVFVQGFVWRYTLFLLSKYPGMKWMGYMLSVCSTFKHFRKLPSVSDSGCTISCFSQQCMVVPVVYQHLVWSDFWMLAIPVSVWWYLLVASVWVSLLMDDVEHSFMCLFVIGISFLVRCLFMSLAHF